MAKHLYLKDTIDYKATVFWGNISAKARVEGGQVGMSSLGKYYI